LLEPSKKINYCFYEQKEQFIWHEGLLFDNASIQISVFKDLVSLVDPTSKYSFLSFLHNQGRLYNFINANFSSVKRIEFNQYFQWVCSKLKNLYFGNKVESINFKDRFIVQSNKNTVGADNIVIGIGQKPFIPKWAKNHISDNVFHAGKYLKLKNNLKNKRVAVIGGGQTGAEIFLDLLNSSKGEPPLSCLWLTRRNNFFPLDDSPFSNELFMPIYSNYFSTLPLDAKEAALQELKLTNLGISKETVKNIYQLVYINNFLKENSINLALNPGRNVVELNRTTNGYQIITDHNDKGNKEVYDVDIIILATGYCYKVPDFLEPLTDRIEFHNNEPVVKEDFSISLDVPNQGKNRVYVQNWSIQQKGIADPNLSLISWRSAKIINSLAGEKIYEDNSGSSLITWENQGTMRENQESKII
jgi:lysine N6-hydroxylase